MSDWEARAGRARILQVVADGRPGGGTSHVLQLARSLDGDGFTCTVVSDRGSHALAAAAAAGLATDAVDFFRGGRFDPRPWHALRRLIRVRQPHLIHAHGARAALPVTFACRGTPLVYTVHGYHFTEKPALLRRLAMLAERRCAGAATATVFVCQHDRELARRSRLLPRAGREHVVVNGVDVARLPRAHADGGAGLVFLGRLVPQKDPLLLVEILRHLPDPTLRLTVIGDGPLAPQMRAQAEAAGMAGRIVFLGEMPRNEALATLARASAMVLPSRWEGLPIAILEAMAIGVPVVASAVGGVGEIIDHGRSGFLAPAGDAAAFAGAVRRLHGAPCERAVMIAAARATVAERFDWATTRQRHRDLYRAVLAASPPPGAA